MIENKLDKSFGSSGSFAGYIVFLAGIYSITSGFGFLLLLLGAFLGFSYSGVQIDNEKKQLRFFNCYFGIFKVGIWSDLNIYTSISIYKNKRKEQAYSKGNRTMNIEHNDFRVFLISQEKQKRIAIKKCKTKNEAELAAKDLGSKLGIALLQ